MKGPVTEEILAAYAALPEPYQPVWGAEESRSKARRRCDDRMVFLRDAVAAFPYDGKPLRILDIGCAQGYFTLALKYELEQQGRTVEMIGVDYLKDNVRFCQMLAADRGMDIRFLHDRFDGDFFERHGMANFDIVLALNVLHHVRELDGAQAAIEVLEAIRQHTAVLLCELAQSAEALEWIGDWHASDDDLLAGFSFRRRLASFGTHLTEVKRPLYACSNCFAYVGARWFAFDHYSDRAHVGVPESFVGQRRFFVGADVVVKQYRGTGDHAEFNREELAAEQAALAELGSESTRYPAVLAHADDGNVIWLVRSKLPGKLLSEIVLAGEVLDRNAVARALLLELGSLERRGFHHADIRTWNLLWRDGELRLIDFGSLTRVASPLHRIALAAVLAELATLRLSYNQAFYCSLQSPLIYPSSWFPLLSYLLGTSSSDFRYDDALTVFSEGVKSEAGENLRWDTDKLMISGEILDASMREQVEGFQRLLRHNEDQQKALHKAVADFEKAHAEAHAQLAEAARYAQTLRIKIEHDAGEMDTERAAAQAQLAEAAQYRRILQFKIEHDAGEIAAERAAMHAQLADAARYTRELEVRIEHDSREACAERSAAQVLLNKAAAHGSALQAELVRVTTEAQIHHEVSQAALAEAGIAGETLKSQNDELHGQLKQLRQQLEQVDVRYQQLIHRHSILRRRFRLLSLFMPKDVLSSKDSE